MNEAEFVRSLFQGLGRPHCFKLVLPDIEYLLRFR